MITEKELEVMDLKKETEDLRVLNQNNEYQISHILKKMNHKFNNNFKNLRDLENFIYEKETNNHSKSHENDNKIKNLENKNDDLLNLNKQENIPVKISETDQIKIDIDTELKIVTGRKKNSIDHRYDSQDDEKNQLKATVDILENKIYLMNKNYE